MLDGSEGSPGVCLVARVPNQTCTHTQTERGQHPNRPQEIEHRSMQVKDTEAAARLEHAPDLIQSRHVGKPVKGLPKSDTHRHSRGAQLGATSVQKQRSMRATSRDGSRTGQAGQTCAASTASTELLCKPVCKHQTRSTSVQKSRRIAKHARQVKGAHVVRAAVNQLHRSRLHRGFLQRATRSNASEEPPRRQKQ